MRFVKEKNKLKSNWKLEFFKTYPKKYIFLYFAYLAKDITAKSSKELIKIDKKDISMKLETLTIEWEWKLW